MKTVERINVNFMFASAAELKAAERKQARLERAGYALVSHVGTVMTYRLDTGFASKFDFEVLPASTGFENLSSPTCSVDVAWTPNNHGYPYRATCSCGWQSLGYVREHAAQAMADDHVASR